jgi:hypothetical protein
LSRNSVISPVNYISRNQLDFQKSPDGVGLPLDQAEIGNDFQKKCRKGAKFAAHTSFPAILGDISHLFSLALEFFTRFRGAPQSVDKWFYVNGLQF